MSDPNTSYFFRRFYRNIIKWWYVVYNPIARKIWHSKEEAEEARLEEERQRILKEEEESRQAALKAEEEAKQVDLMEEEARLKAEMEAMADETYNATTGSFSGLYGKGPVDASTQAALDEIMGKNKKNDDFASLVNNGSITITPSPAPAPANGPSKEEQNAVLAEANAIYERLMREAAEDEAKKQAEIDAAKAAQK